MTDLTGPTVPGNPLARAAWSLHDAWLLTRRELTQLRHQPGELIVVIVFPAVMILLFGYVFGSAIDVPGGNYREYLLPGLLAMTAVVGVGGGALAVSRDVAEGVMDRFRSMPLARSAVPAGRAAADVLNSVLNVVVTCGLGLLVGWHFHHGLLRALAAIGLVLLMRYAVTWIGIVIGLSVKPETADSLVPITLPVAILSSSFVPTAGMPAWLRVVAEWNPVSALVGACRELFGNPTPVVAHPSLPVAHPVAVTIAWCAVLLLVFVPLAVWRYAAPNR